MEESNPTRRLPKKRTARKSMQPLLPTHYISTLPKVQILDSSGSTGTGSSNMTSDASRDGHVYAQVRIVQPASARSDQENSDTESHHLNYAGNPLHIPDFKHREANHRNGRHYLHDPDYPLYRPKQYDDVYNREVHTKEKRKEADRRRRSYPLMKPPRIYPPTSGEEPALKPKISGLIKEPSHGYLPLEVNDHNPKEKEHMLPKEKYKLQAKMAALDSKMQRQIPAPSQTQSTSALPRNNPRNPPTSAPLISYTSAGCKVTISKASKRSTDLVALKYTEDLLRSPSVRLAPDKPWDLNNDPTNHGRSDEPGVNHNNDVANQKKGDKASANQKKGEKVSANQKKGDKVSTNQKKIDKASTNQKIVVDEAAANQRTAVELKTYSRKQSEQRLLNAASHQRRSDDLMVDVKDDENNEERQGNLLPSQRIGTKQEVPNDNNPIYNYEKKHRDMKMKFEEKFAYSSTFDSSFPRTSSPIHDPLRKNLYDVALHQGDSSESKSLKPGQTKTTNECRSRKTSSMITHDGRQVDAKTDELANVHPPDQAKPSELASCHEKDFPNEAAKLSEPSIKMTISKQHNAKKSSKESRRSSSGLQRAKPLLRLKRDDETNLPVSATQADDGHWTVKLREVLKSEASAQDYQDTGQVAAAPNDSGQIAENFGDHHAEAALLMDHPMISDQIQDLNENKIPTNRNFVASTRDSNGQYKTGTEVVRSGSSQGKKSGTGSGQEKKLSLGSSQERKFSPGSSQEKKLSPGSSQEKKTGRTLSKKFSGVGIHQEDYMKKIERARNRLSIRGSKKNKHRRCLSAPDKSLDPKRPPGRRPGQERGSDEKKPKCERGKSKPRRRSDFGLHKAPTRTADSNSEASQENKAEEIHDQQSPIIRKPTGDMTNNNENQVTDVRGNLIDTNTCLKKGNHIYESNMINIKQAEYSDVDVIKNKVGHEAFDEKAGESRWMRMLAETVDSGPKTGSKYMTYSAASLEMENFKANKGIQIKTGGDIKMLRPTCGEKNNAMTSLDVNNNSSKDTSKNMSLDAPDTLIDSDTGEIFNLAPKKKTTRRGSHAGFSPRGSNVGFSPAKPQRKRGPKASSTPDKSRRRRSTQLTRTPDGGGTPGSSTIDRVVCVLKPSPRKNRLRRKRSFSESAMGLAETSLRKKAKLTSQISDEMEIQATRYMYSKNPGAWGSEAGGLNPGCVIKPDPDGLQNPDADPLQTVAECITRLERFQKNTEDDHLSAPIKPDPDKPPRRVIGSIIYINSSREDESTSYNSAKIPDMGVNTDTPTTTNPSQKTDTPIPVSSTEKASTPKLSQAEVRPAESTIDADLVSSSGAVQKQSHGDPSHVNCDHSTKFDAVGPKDSCDSMDSVSTKAYSEEDHAEQQTNVDDNRMTSCHLQSNQEQLTFITVSEIGMVSGSVDKFTVPPDETTEQGTKLVEDENPGSNKTVSSTTDPEPPRGSTQQDLDHLKLLKNFVETSEVINDGTGNHSQVPHQVPVSSTNQTEVDQSDPLEMTKVGSEIPVVDGSEDLAYTPLLSTMLKAAIKTLQSNQPSLDEMSDIPRESMTCWYDEHRSRKHGVPSKPLDVDNKIYQLTRNRVYPQAVTVMPVHGATPGNMSSFSLMTPGSTATPGSIVTPGSFITPGSRATPDSLLTPDSMDTPSIVQVPGADITPDSITASKAIVTPGSLTASDSIATSAALVTMSSVAGPSVNDTNLFSPTSSHTDPSFEQTVDHTTEHTPERPEHEARDQINHYNTEPVVLLEASPGKVDVNGAGEALAPKSLFGERHMINHESLGKVKVSDISNPISCPQVPINGVPSISESSRPTLRAVLTSENKQGAESAQITRADKVSKPRRKRRKSGKKNDHKGEIAPPAGAPDTQHVPPPALEPPSVPRLPFYPPFPYYPYDPNLVSNYQCPPGDLGRFPRPAKEILPPPWTMYVRPPFHGGLPHPLLPPPKRISPPPVSEQQTGSDIHRNAPSTCGQSSPKYKEQGRHSPSGNLKKSHGGSRKPGMVENRPENSRVRKLSSSESNIPLSSANMRWYPQPPNKQTSAGVWFPPTAQDLGRPMLPTAQDLGRPMPPTAQDLGRPMPPTAQDLGRPIPPTVQDLGRPILSQLDPSRPQSAPQNANYQPRVLLNPRSRSVEPDPSRSEDMRRIQEGNRATPPQSQNHEFPLANTIYHYKTNSGLGPIAQPMVYSQPGHSMAQSNTKVVSSSYLPVPQPPPVAGASQRQAKPKVPSPGGTDEESRDGSDNKKQSILYRAIVLGKKSEDEDSLPGFPRTAATASSQERRTNIPQYVPLNHFNAINQEGSNSPLEGLRISTEAHKHGHTPSVLLQNLLRHPLTPEGNRDVRSGLGGYIAGGPGSDTRVGPPGTGGAPGVSDTRGGPVKTSDTNMAAGMEKIAFPLDHNKPVEMMSGIRDCVSAPGVSREALRPVQSVTPPAHPAISDAQVLLQTLAKTIDTLNAQLQAKDLMLLYLEQLVREERWQREQREAQLREERQLKEQLEQQLKLANQRTGPSKS